MKTLTVRAVPEATYQTLKACAQMSHRSLQEQILDILTREARLVQGKAISPARKWRALLQDRNCGDIVADLRSERER